MKTFIIQYRTSASARWYSFGRLLARNHANAIARAARSLGDINEDSLEISACLA